jgi:hypothetical protein
MVPIVVSEFQFFEIKREVLFRDAMVLDKPLLGPTPESLQTVDVDPCRKRSTCRGPPSNADSHRT